MIEKRSDIEDSIKVFEFGKNWRLFLNELDETRILEAERSLKEMLQVERLTGMSFLDAGCGSGLFSLAARRMGAKVLSFDVDSESVRCAETLRKNFFANDPFWIVETGSVLDYDFLKKVGVWDIVYCWGVLHHTGNMWLGMELIGEVVKPGGKLFVAIYNDQGRKSRVWRKIKKNYNTMPRLGQAVLVGVLGFAMWGPRIILDTLRGNPLQTWRQYKQSRGMSPWRDVIDWVGGYPFEVAKPEDVFQFYRKRGFTLEKLKTAGGGHGNNQFVFRKTGHETGD